MKTKIITLMVIVSLLLIGIVYSGVTLTTNDKITLPKDKQEYLTNKGIKDLKIIEYECEGNRRCFKFDGDLKDNLINVPKQVCGEQIYREIKDKKGNVITKVRTSKCIYRDITDKEIMQLITLNFNSKLNKMIESDTTKEKGSIKYNPIIIMGDKI